MGSSGKRVAPRQKRSVDPTLLLLAVGATGCLVAWGYLVKSAIDFGSAARGGRPEAWWFLALASLGAIACLFVGLILGARILRRLGITSPPSTTPAAPGAVRPVGGRRALR